MLVAMRTTNPPARGRRGVEDACTRMGWPRKASVKGGSVEPSKKNHAGDRRMLLMPSPEVVGAQTKISGGGGAVDPTPEEELPG
jgi:hypothetical protein